MTQPPYDFDAIFSELRGADLSPKILRCPSSKALQVNGVVADSRKSDLTKIFCAIKGASHDGHLTLTANAARLAMVIVDGSTAAISLDSLPGDFGAISVTSTRAAWAQLASFFAGHPSQKLKMLGITGTNGKTSCAWMVKGILDSLKISCASIGTLGFHCGEVHTKSQHTTPDPDVLYPSLQAFVAQGVRCVVMEVSSHSLVQGKVWPIQFNGASFTSFSQDHLDFHANMDDYFAAKMQLFTRQLAAKGFALFHHSVASRPLAKNFLTCNVDVQSLKKTYGRLPSKADYVVTAKSHYTQGLSQVNVCDVSCHDSGNFVTSMVGDVFSENFAAALILVSQAFTRTLAEISTALAAPQALRISPVPGRLELVSDAVKPWRPLVYVDYAHTPDALEKAILNLSSQPKSVTTVFGCGGDRDKIKRPIMGELAARLSKNVIVTSDNPRTEDQKAIVNDVVRGTASFSNVTAIVDRREAISSALFHSGARDVILIAGKGHENYQVIGTEETHFSDQEESLKILSRPRSWLVFGAGVSGFAAASHLDAAGEHVYLCDDNAITPPAGFSPKIEILSLDAVPWSEIWTVLISPGIPLTHAVVVTARGLSKDVITEIDLGFNRYSGSILAVTGTNGKSTTVMMAEFLCRKIGMSADACGNIGLPPSALNLRSRGSDHVAVVELSSYQLEGCSAWPARAAAITSFSFDHLARHKTMASYFAAKWRVVEWLNEDSLFVVSAGVVKAAQEYRQPWPRCPSVIIGASPPPVTLPPNATYICLDHGKCVLNTKPVDFEALGVLGHHNQVNALTAALMVGAISGKPLDVLLPLVSAYKPLAYRCEVVFDDGHRKIVNDSKSTNLESTIAALSVANQPLILLMGGQGKGESYTSLTSNSNSIKCLITFGASREEIAKDARDQISTVVFEKMQAAVLHALQVASDNKWNIIFSPGCASFDEFKNFEHRGAVFNELVDAFVARKS